MNKITQIIGQALASELDESLRQPMDWTMIDALAKLQEAEEQAAQTKTQSPPISQPDLKFS